MKDMKFLRSNWPLFILGIIAIILMLVILDRRKSIIPHFQDGGGKAGKLRPSLNLPSLAVVYTPRLTC
jgi:hypothetical protein